MGRPHQAPIPNTRIIAGKANMNALCRSARRSRPAYSHSINRLTGLASTGRMVSRVIHHPTANPATALAMVVQARPIEVQLST